MDDAVTATAAASADSEDTVDGGDDDTARDSNAAVDTDDVQVALGVQAAATPAVSTRPTTVPPRQASSAGTLKRPLPGSASSAIVRQQGVGAGAAALAARKKTKL